jgi:hyperosmotically inducible periplasmic protein
MDERIIDEARQRLELGRRKGAQSWQLVVGSVTAALGAGMAAMYFFDPDRGRSRRAQTVDRIGSTLRRGGRRAGQAARRASAEAYGLSQQVRHMGPDAGVPENDAVLSHKVETVLFRDPGIDKGRININAEDGVVVLRGTAESPERIRDIEDRVRAIDGVKDVRSRLHLPETPAPGRPEALVR